MKIQRHLIMLVCAALLPALIFIAVLTAWFWTQQRSASEARYLDRVRALEQVEQDLECIRLWVRDLILLRLAGDRPLTFALGGRTKEA